MSTWGNLRLILGLQSNGVSADLLDSYLNERYSAVLESSDWKGVIYHATLMTTAAYQSGQQGTVPDPGLDSVDLVVGNNTASIVNTPGQNPAVGMRFYVPGDSVIYTIGSVTVPATTGAITAGTLGTGGQGYAVNQILNVVQGTASYGQFQVTATGGGGTITALVLLSGGIGYTAQNGLSTTSSSGCTLTVTSVGAGGNITGLTIGAGGINFVVGQILGIVQAGGALGSATVTAVSTTGAVTAATILVAGTGYSIAPSLPTTTSSGATINVTAVTSITFTLDRNYEGNGSDSPGTPYLETNYVYMQNVYALPSDVRTLVSVLDPVTGFPLNLMSKDNLDMSVGPRTLVNDPQSCAMYDDSPDSAPPVTHQLELFPPPLYARGFNVEYLHQAIGFDGSNTNGSPMPWVSDTILLHGCRADIAMYMAGMAETPAQAGVYATQAKGYEAKFQEALKRLLMEEHARRRQKTALKMANRFVRHRMMRAGREISTIWRGGQLGGPN